MLTRERVLAWLGGFGWGYLDERVVESGWGFFVSTQPDAYHAGDRFAVTYGNGPMVVLKSNGAMYQFGSHPDVFPIYEATSEEEFHRAVRKAGFRRAKPDGYVR